VGAKRKKRRVRREAEKKNWKERKKTKCINFALISICDFLQGRHRTDNVYAYVHRAQARLCLFVFEVFAVVAMIRISGSSGYWFEVGHNMDGEDMISDWVPCSASGQCLHIHRKNGYYCFHLPHNGKSVYFHRQLYKDVKFQDIIPKTHEIHHKNFQKNDNRTENLEMMTKKRHRRLTALYNRRQ
jgi:hypothetical protein